MGRGEAAAAAVRGSVYFRAALPGAVPRGSLARGERPPMWVTAPHAFVNIAPGNPRTAPRGDGWSRGRARIHEQQNSKV